MNLFNLIKFNEIKFLKVFKVVLVLFLLFEVYFSFHRHKYFVLDGDISTIVYGYNETKRDPFGINPVLHDSTYGGPNRYFAIMGSCIYLKNAPIIFQLMSSPVKSIYLACAFIKTLTQFLLIYLLSFLITFKIKPWEFDFLIAASLIAPLYQIYGYHWYMGIIDYSVTYTFFYAFALCPVIIFFIPFFNRVFDRRSSDFSFFTTIWLVILIIISVFNGPLNPGVILVICSFSLFYSLIRKIMEHKSNLHFKSLMILLLAIVLSIYSLYVGSYNSENLWEVLSIKQRYQKLWEGIVYYYTDAAGPVILITMILINAIIVWKNRTVTHANTILKIIVSTFCMILIYMLLLPLGGYRDYRPLILRNDTLVPVTLAIIFIYGLTTFYIIKMIKFRFRVYYSIIASGITLFFIISDTEYHKYNKCEINALEKIANSPDKIVFIDNNCSVLNWGKTLDPRSTYNGSKLLQQWGVTSEEKLYYQK